MPSLLLPAKYRSSEHVEISRRPDRSAVYPNFDVPMEQSGKSPCVQAFASPLNPKNDADVLENSPLRTSPGPM